MTIRERAEKKAKEDAETHRVSVVAGMIRRREDIVKEHEQRLQGMDTAIEKAINGIDLPSQFTEGGEYRGKTEGRY